MKRYLRSSLVSLLDFTQLYSMPLYNCDSITPYLTLKLLLCYSRLCYSILLRIGDFMLFYSWISSTNRDEKKDENGDAEERIFGGTNKVWKITS